MASERTDTTPPVEIQGALDRPAAGAWAERLPPSFYERDATVVARAMIGTYLVHALQDGDARVGRVVETEAYRGPKDLACHARVGLTKRTRTLLGAPGHAYVYLIYGMYDCFNVVCGGEGRGHAVLVRAVEPVFGMVEGARADGPGRLARAMAITRAHDGEDLRSGRIYLSPRDGRPKLAVSARVGVGYAGAWADAPLRFYDADSRAVSRPSPRQIGSGNAGDVTAPPTRRTERARGHRR